MQYHLTTTYFTNQKNVIEKSGDLIWDALCDGLTKDCFTMGEAVDVIRATFGYSHSTALSYARAVIANVMAEGGNVLTKTGLFYHWV